MTENEAKEWLQCIANMKLAYDKAKNSRKKACEIAIKALEEIQQYRALEEKLNGISVEQVVNAFIDATEKRSSEGYERGRILTNTEADEWEQLKAIGTVEEFKGLKEKNVAKKPLLRLCGDCQRDCVDCDRYEDKCPTCNGGLYVESGKPHEHCPNCGQALDWQ